MNRGRIPARGAGAAFLISAVASLGLMVTYALGGQPQVEGTLIFFALGGLSVGLITWAKELMPGGGFVEEREPLEPPAPARRAMEEDAVAGAEAVGRRRFLGGTLAAALAALGAAALFPVRSLGERPGRTLYETAFRAGSRLVTQEGRPVHVTELDVGGVLTVFPEGATEATEAATLLIRVDGDYEPLPGREDWVPEGHVAFSKICTHAGCPVGLYQPQQRQLFCPCHQSIFDVMEHAAPVTGPATRPLPQLPLEVDDAGFLRAQADYREPTGPGFWGRGRA